MSEVIRVEYVTHHGDYYNRQTLTLPKAHTWEDVARMLSEVDYITTPVSERVARQVMGELDQTGTAERGWTRFTVQPEREDADGHPYLAYYRNDLVLGFIWSGKPEHPVQVTREMGERVIDEFHLSVASGKPADIAERFKNACDTWADENVTNNLFGLPITPSIIITAKED